MPTPVFVPERKDLDALLRDASGLPKQMCDPVGGAAGALLRRSTIVRINPCQPTPVPVAPGSLGTGPDDDVAPLGEIERLNSTPPTTPTSPSVRANRPMRCGRSSPAISDWRADHRRPAVDRHHRARRRGRTAKVNLVGYGPLTSLLADDDVWEIMINAPDAIFVKRHNGPSGYHHEGFDDDHVLRTITRIVDRSAAHTERST